MMGVSTKTYHDEIPESWEPRGKGVNKFTYWVTHSVLDPWIELPLIAPEHVTVAR